MGLFPGLLNKSVEFVGFALNKFGDDPETLTFSFMQLFDLKLLKIPENNGSFFRFAQ